MLNGKQITAVLPAYNAAGTLKRTVDELDRNVVDEVLLVDDASSDDTVEQAEKLGLISIRHQENLGYGANQKSCYKAALDLGADIVVMLHPDYQYSPLLVPALAAMIAYGQYDFVLGSRILAQNSIARGMPVYKYAANRVLTFCENLVLRQKLSEYHTGLRAYSRELLEALPFAEIPTTSSSTTRSSSRPSCSGRISASSPVRRATRPTRRQSASARASDTASACCGPPRSTGCS